MVFSNALCLFGGEPEAGLPNGVRAVWDLAKAWRETTPTREKVCLNGLWRWQPAANELGEVPSANWGHYKVPAAWPGIQDYMQSDYQALYAAPAWKDTRLAGVKSAWYQRTITIPAEWTGRRIVLHTAYLNSFAKVFIDGQPVGELRFPAGEVDLSQVVRPGSTHLLSMQVTAMPLKALMESYTDTNAARQRPGSVERRGLCGDVWLESQPAGARLGHPSVATSVTAGEIAFRATLTGLKPGRSYCLQAVIRDDTRPVAEFKGSSLLATNSTGLAAFTNAWRAPKLWDLHTPGNQYWAEVSLLDSAGRRLDTAYPVRFGFREMVVQGRDLWLNGSKVFLSMVPLDNAQVGAALATYAAAKESLLRLKSFGINFVYTHNYGCEPGAHLSFEDILRAADDAGMLVALSQPHFSAYDWKSPDAELTNGYAAHAQFYAGVAGSHPSVVAYSMSHNSAGYNEDMNPKMVGRSGAQRDQWSARNAASASRCEAIVRRLDPTRFVYHHAGADLGSVYSVNFYPNFVPIQEMDDWFGNWSASGTLPLLLVEYGAPFGWDWTMYRGWYAGKREFGSAAVPWEYCLAEWNAQFLGDAAYRLGEREKRNLRWEAERFRKGGGWYRWDYPTPVGDVRLEEMQPVQSAYITANWRAFRTWGLSGNSPWEHGRFWKLRDGFQPRRTELPVDWDQLQRPGYSPDFIDRTYARFDLAHERSDWVPTAAAQALLRNNLPWLGWIAGKPERFTTRDHLFSPGETFEKQLIVINNTRSNLTGEVAWSSDMNGTPKGSRPFRLPTGEQARIPVTLAVPDDLRPGSYRIEASFRLGDGQRQEDVFEFQVLPAPPPVSLNSRVALFDPPGQTARWLDSLGIAALKVDASSDLSGIDVLLIGKGALTLDGPSPKLHRVREGLRVVVFEQTAGVLEKRLGFRVAEYGLRQVWRRVPDSPLLQGLDSAALRDWRGEATLTSPTRDYTLNPRYNGAPTVQWCGLEVPRLWRCGNQGSVASVLIEKPPRGDFLPIMDGGYALQYSALLEYREGRGMVLFCQMDVTGRTERDPAAETLGRNILRYVDSWRAAPSGGAFYLGSTAGADWLAAAGVNITPFEKQANSANAVLIVAPATGEDLSSQRDPIRDWTLAGGRVLAIGLDQQQVNAVLPGQITVESAEHIATTFTPCSTDSPFVGVSPADLMNRDPRPLPLLKTGINVIGNGVLGFDKNLVLFQLRPWEFEREPARFNQRRTFGRVSFALARVLSNLGVKGTPPLLERFEGAVDPQDSRWTEGLYLTRPVEWDDPYRFFRW